MTIVRNKQIMSPLPTKTIIIKTAAGDLMETVSVTPESKVKDLLKEVNLPQGYKLTLGSGNPPFSESEQIYSWIDNGELVYAFQQPKGGFILK